MGTTLGTLSNLAIYIGLVVLGAFLGSRKALRSRPLVWVSKLQFVALMILIVTLGVNLGANDEVISSLGEIGLSALVFGVPCIFLALGYLAGMALGLGEGASVGTAAVGLLVGFLPAVWVNRWITRSQKPEFVILRHQA